MRPNWSKLPSGSLCQTKTNIMKILFCSNCEYMDTVDRNHGNRCPKCGSRLVRPKFEVGDKVRILTNNDHAQGTYVPGLIKDIMKCDEGAIFYQVQVLLEDWVVSEAEVHPHAPKYSLNCDYYTREFNTIDELVDDVMTSGMDPNYEITFDGKGIGEQAADLIQY
jgi:DNA-directed RNA polymerase subunit RPC12/RpoP